MSISSADIQWFNAALTSASVPAQNGGRQSQTQSVSGVKNNLFPDVSAAERASGAEHWRKLFAVLKSADDLPLADVRISLEACTPGESYVLLHQSDPLATQADVGWRRPFGVGALAEASAIGAQSLEVTTEADFSGWSDQPFQEGDVVRVDARADCLSPGACEYALVDSVSFVGASVTLTLEAPLAHAYPLGAAVASAIEYGTLVARADDLVLTGGVTYDAEALPIAVSQVGCCFQQWTVTVTNAATGALSLSGDTLGAVGTGSTGVDLAPANPDGGVYFTLAAAGWGGTPANGDSLSFLTYPASAAIFLHRVIPAGAGTLALDRTVLCLEGESP